MRLSNFDYNLPREIIAQEPKKPRDHSRLLVLDKKTGKIEHEYFYDIVDHLESGDVLVLNNSKVFPARLIGKRQETGGKMEVFLLRSLKSDVWQCLLGGPRRREGLKIEFNKKLVAELVKDNKDGTWNVRFNKSGKELMKNIQEIGQTPLPPYIKRQPSPPQQAGAPLPKGGDSLNYQTVYADEAKIGSVAAPTAGFHFTPELIKKLKKKGVQLEYVTLHVGLGTFAPVKVDDITKHKIHSEWVEVDGEVIERIRKAKKEKRRVIAVGTTSVRTLEAIWQKGSPSTSSGQSLRDWVNIFIYPGYKFKVVDAMITNFHLPKSTLLMLVSAFANRDIIFKAYEEAIEKQYRFYSYGDAMLIL